MSVNLNQFTSRSASTGSLYTYVVSGLGPTAGFIAGWALLLAYIITTSAVLSGFINFSNQLLKGLGLTVPLIVLGIAGAAIAWFVAYKDIKLSAKITLILEGISIIAISILGIIVLIHNGLKIDFSQFTLKNVSPSSIRIGLVLAFFSFTGFESAASLGGEAKKPLQTIPKAILYSSIIVGAFFVIFSYIEVMGYINSSTKLYEASAPLTTLANLNSVGFLGPIISLGTLFSFWASFLACSNAGGRLLFSIGRNGIINSAVGNVHENNKTPHVAIIVVVIVATIVPTILISLKNGVADIYGWLGTIATYGFLFSYVLITIATPFYLYKERILKVKDIIISVITFAILLIPIVGSVYPVPAYPYNIFPFIFLIWIVFGTIWFNIQKFRKPELGSTIKESANFVNKQIKEEEKGEII